MILRSIQVSFITADIVPSKHPIIKAMMIAKNANISVLGMASLSKSSTGFPDWYEERR